MEQLVNPARQVPRLGKEIERRRGVASVRESSTFHLDMPTLRPRCVSSVNSNRMERVSVASVKSLPMKRPLHPHRRVTSPVQYPNYLPVMEAALVRATLH